MNNLSLYLVLCNMKKKLESHLDPEFENFLKALITIHRCSRVEYFEDLWQRLMPQFNLEADKHEQYLDPVKQKLASWESHCQFELTEESTQRVESIKCFTAKTSKKHRWATRDTA